MVTRPKSDLTFFRSTSIDQNAHKMMTFIKFVVVVVDVIRKLNLSTGYMTDGNAIRTNTNKIKAIQRVS